MKLTGNMVIWETKAELIGLLNAVFAHNKRGRLLNRSTGQHMRCCECHAYLTPFNFGQLFPGNQMFILCDNIICTMRFSIDHEDAFDAVHIGVDAPSHFLLTAEKQGG